VIGSMNFTKQGRAASYGDGRLTPEAIPMISSEEKRIDAFKKSVFKKSVDILIVVKHKLPNRFPQTVF
jgi:hypothetical protein